MDHKHPIQGGDFKFSAHGSLFRHVKKNNNYYDANSNGSQIHRTAF